MLIERSDCDVPLSFDIATISSASEGESEAIELWVSNGAYKLSRSDEGIILSPRRWLTDEVISAAQMQFYPSTAGLQPPVLQKVFAFQVRNLSRLCMSGTTTGVWCPQWGARARVE